ncbi:MAG: CinA family protein [Candidatus Omnitrophota bacterium]|nr:CinA family protein [Candidatus Omnitrophota bacterium]
MSSEIDVGKILRKKKLTLAIAESCTGGLISDRITNVAGSSAYFLCGVVAYSNGIKENLLGVSFRHCERPKGAKPACPAGRQSQKCDAVSKDVAIEMARGVRLLAGTDIGIGVTGIAGPGGGTRSKPVGLVYIALVMDKKQVVKKFRFKGSRQNVKFQASEAALDLICEHS